MWTGEVPSEAPQLESVSRTVEGAEKNEDVQDADDGLLGRGVALGCLAGSHCEERCVGALGIVSERAIKTVDVDVVQVERPSKVRCDNDSGERV